MEISKQLHCAQEGNNAEPASSDSNDGEFDTVSELSNGDEEMRAYEPRRGQKRSRLFSPRPAASPQPSTSKGPNLGTSRVGWTWAEQFT